LIASVALRVKMTFVAVRGVDETRDLDPGRWGLAPAAPRRPRLAPPLTIL